MHEMDNTQPALFNTNPSEGEEEGEKEKEAEEMGMEAWRGIHGEAWKGHIQEEDTRKKKAHTKRKEIGT